MVTETDEFLTLTQVLTTGWIIEPISRRMPGLLLKSSYL